MNPGRFIRVVAWAEISNEDFIEPLEELNQELARFNAEARKLEKTIAKNVPEILEI